MKTDFLFIEPMSDDDPFGRKSQRFANHDIFGINGLMQNSTLSEMWLLTVFKGEMPTQQQVDVFNAISVALTHHGPCHPATLAARNAGAPGATIPGMMVTAIATQSARAREMRLTMVQIEEGYRRNSSDKWEEIFCVPPEPHPYKLTTEVTHPKLDHIPGFRIQGEGCITEAVVVQTLNYLALILANNMGAVQWLKQNRNALENFAGAPIDMIMVVSAAFVDLNITPEYAEALYLHIFSFGATFSAIEARQKRHVEHPWRSIHHVQTSSDLKRILVKQDEGASELRAHGENGLSAYVGPWPTTNVWLPNHDNPENAQVLTHGINTLSLFGKKTWMELACFGVSEKWPERNDGEVSILETLSLGLAYPAVNIWPNCTAAICGSERVDPAMMNVAIGATFNAVIFGQGSRVSSSRTLKHLYSLTKNLSQEKKKEILKLEIQKVPKFLPGFGRPVPQRDERVVAFLRIMKERGMEIGLHLQLALLLEEVFLEDKKKLKFGYPGLNTAGFMAAIFLDLDLLPEIYMDYLIPSFFAGAVVPYMDTLRRPEGTFWPIPLTAISCEYKRYR